MSVGFEWSITQCDKPVNVFALDLMSFSSCVLMDTHQGVSCWEPTWRLLLLVENENTS